MIRAGRICQNEGVRGRGGKMRIVARLLSLLAVLLPVCAVVSSATSSANSGGGSPSDVGVLALECTNFKGGFQLSPEITNTPADQTAVGHGRMYGCSRYGGSAHFSGTFHMPHATCADLSMAGTARFDWTDGSFSTATMTLTSQALAQDKMSISGTVVGGRLPGLRVFSWVRFTPVFTGNGPACSSSNPLQTIDFTNTRSFQLLRHRTTTTTVTFPRTTSTFHGTTTTHESTTTAGPTSTVPIVLLGSTAAPTTASTVHQAGGGGAGGGTNTPSSPNQTGELALTGNNRAGALFGLESMVIGGALACYGRGRSAERARTRKGPKFWLRVTLPPT